MIQRIQTVYLLVACILLAIIFVFPYAELLGANDQVYIFNYNGLSLLGQDSLYFLTVPPIILLGLTVLIGLVSIFLFKKRVLQMRLNFINLILILGYIGLNYYYIHSFSNQLNGMVSYKITAAFPLVAVILIFLAIKSIGKDEALIRSMDRLR